MADYAIADTNGELKAAASQLDIPWARTWLAGW